MPGINHKISLNIPHVLFACLVGWACLFPSLASSQEEPQAWLLTYAPGEIYWQRFGHNAIWIRDPTQGIDHTFNFGFFDFEQDGFLKNFIHGRLNYFAAARPADREIADYTNENRTIRAQRLNLDEEQFARLRDHLLLEVSAGNREYLYDYYQHNCSTRVRDALDFAVGGLLRDYLEPIQAPLNYRDHTRRLTDMDSIYYLGLQTGLGSPVDRSVSRWNETFIPGVLADAMTEIDHPDSGDPLVLEDVILYESGKAGPGERTHPVWTRYLLVAISLLLIAGLLCRIARITPTGLAMTWVLISGIAGAVLAYLWLLTDHWAAGLNLNLLLLNPLWMLIVLPPLRRHGARLMVICGLLALFGPYLPPGQYTADVVALVLPLNLAAAAILLRRFKAAADPL